MSRPGAGGVEPPTCPWCDSSDTQRLGEAGSLLMTEQWYCDDCSSAFEVIRKRGRDSDRHSTRPNDPDDDPASP